MCAGTQQVQQLQGSMWCTCWVVSCCVGRHTDSGVGVWCYLALCFTCTCFCTHAGDCCDIAVHPAADQRAALCTPGCASQFDYVTAMLLIDSAVTMADQVRGGGVSGWTGPRGASRVSPDLLHDQGPWQPSCLCCTMGSDCTMRPRHCRGCFGVLR